MASRQPYTLEIAGSIPAPATMLPSLESVVEEVKKHTDTVFLAFSRGKDSIAAWLALRPHFKIIPYHMWLVPGLRFVEESLAYFEQVFETRIYRVPHPSFYRMLNAFTFQPPERLAIIEAAELPEIEYHDNARMLAEDLGIASTWQAHGVRAADSPNRRRAVLIYGAVNYKRRSFAPICAWRKQQVMDIIQQNGIKLPVDYQLFGRSFDGIDYRFIQPIKEHLPNDYAVIKEWFPLVELEIMRRELG